MSVHIGWRLLVPVQGEEVLRVEQLGGAGDSRQVSLPAVVTAQAHPEPARRLFSHGLQMLIQRRGAQ